MKIFDTMSFHKSLKFLLIILVLSILIIQKLKAQSGLPVSNKNNPAVTFFGEGNFLQSVSDLKDVPATAGFGVMIDKKLPNGINFSSYQLSLSINVASSVDTVKFSGDNFTSNRAFASSLLVPRLAKQSANITGKVYLKDWDKSGTNKIIDGYYWNLTASNKYWEKKGEFETEISKKDTTISRFGGMMGLNLGFFHEFSNKDLLEKGISMSWGLGFVGRGMIGDLGQGGDDRKYERKFFLGDKKRFYGGIEAVLAVQLKNIKVQASLPYIFSKNPVPGLSGIQFIPSISFIGGFEVEKD